MFGLERSAQSQAQSFVAKTPPKDNAKSLYELNEVKSDLDENDWTHLMHHNNKSLCFAEKESKTISFAFANRSVGFFHMEEYKKCLFDIDLAIKAGYPKELMPKLEKLKTGCLKRIEEGATSEDFKSKLSFDPDEKFPCMADVLAIERDSNDEFLVIAKEDIDIGKTILVEKAFSTYLYSQHQSRCNACLKENTNLIPCSNCTVAMFCNDECKNNVRHDFECGWKYQTMDQYHNGNVMKEVRLIGQAISLFPSVERLKDFVENIIQTDTPQDLQHTLNGAQSKYRAFLLLPTDTYVNPDEDFASLVFQIYNTILSIPRLGKRFKTQPRRQFLKHLITHHARITSQNSLRTKSKLATGEQCSYIQIGLMLKYFQHSCAPNVSIYGRDGNLIFDTIRPIKKGQQLTFSMIKRQDCERAGCEEASPTNEEK